VSLIRRKGRKLAISGLLYSYTYQITNKQFKGRVIFLNKRIKSAFHVMSSTRISLVHNKEQSPSGR